MDTESHVDLWQRGCERLAAELPEQQFNTWIRPLPPAEISDRGDKAVASVSVPNRFKLDWIRSQYGARIEGVLSEIAGKPVQLELGLQARSAAAAPSPERTPRPAGGAPVAAQPLQAGAPPAMQVAALPPHRLNPALTFDTLVAGRANQMARTAALHVAGAPGQMYNPLFIYGGVGLGKTHLLQAIGNFVVDEHGMRVHYTSSETFMNELILAIRQGRTLEFKNRYRSVDVLLIDDIQFLSGKAGTQEEFFHTFNHLFSAKKQIIIASDRPPKEIDSLEERLQSRFESGLITDLAPPDFETRVAILRKKVEAQGAEVADDVLHHVARGVTSNIRELEGSLVRLLAFASLTGQPVTVAMADEALRGFMRPQRREVRIATIQKVVASEFGVTVEALKSKSRAQRVAFPRQFAIYLTRELTGIPLVEIGKRFGGRDHTTILHAYGKIARLALQDSSLQERLEKTRRLLLFS